MDPQKLSQLDPKLREAYQRVMGTQLPDLQAPPAPPQDEPVQAQNPPPLQPEPTAPTPPVVEETPVQPPIISEPESVSSIPEAPTEPQPAISPQPEAPPVGEPTPESTVQPQQNSNFAQMNSEARATPAPASPISPNFATPAPIQGQTTMTIKKKGGMLTPVMTGIVILVFIAVYTLFWAKIFNFKLPFLP